MIYSPKNRHTINAFMNQAVNIAATNIKNSIMFFIYKIINNQKRNFKCP